ncbi:MAG TPA: OmpH family outer membrane protein [Desulfuromonadales bacterium]|nr:OmpH family outer membrane protein [Desulfuromonadales bacterium]
MHTIVKKLLIALLLAVPTLSAAETAPTLLTAPAPTPAVAEKKPEATTLQTVRIGSVDINKIGTDSDRGKALKALLEERKVGLQAKIDARKKQIEKFKSSIEAKISKMSPQQREAKSKEFQKKLEEFQKFAQSSEEYLYSLQSKESQALFEDIEKAAVAYGTANKLAAVVIKKELLYVSSSVEALDVTADLIKALNEAGLKQ